MHSYASNSRPLHLLNRYPPTQAGVNGYAAEDSSVWGPTSNPRDGSRYPMSDTQCSDFGEDSRSQSPMDGGRLSHSVTPQTRFSDGTPSSSVNASPYHSYHNTPEQKTRDVFSSSPLQSYDAYGAAPPMYAGSQYNGSTDSLPYMENSYDQHQQSQLQTHGLLQMPAHYEEPKITFTRGGRPLTVDDARAAYPNATPSKAAPVPRINGHGSPKKSHPKKSKKDPTRAPLTQPLSILTQHMTHPPVRDMEAFVNRSADVRREEARNRKGNVARPMNSFMLYRSAYAERTKEWCTENNHQIVSAVTGESWKIESDDVKEWFGELAKREREAHQRVFPDYRFKPGKERMEKNAREAEERKKAFKAAGGYQVEDLHHLHLGNKVTSKKMTGGKKKHTYDELDDDIFEGDDSDDVLDDLDDDWSLPATNKKRKINKNVAQTSPQMNDNSLHDSSADTLVIPVSSMGRRRSAEARRAGGSFRKGSPPSIITGVEKVNKMADFDFTSQFRTADHHAGDAVARADAMGGQSMPEKLHGYRQTTGRSPYYAGVISPNAECKTFDEYDVRKMNKEKQAGGIVGYGNTDTNHNGNGNGNGNGQSLIDTLRTHATAVNASHIPNHQNTLYPVPSGFTPLYASHQAAVPANRPQQIYAPHLMDTPNTTRPQPPTPMHPGMRRRSNETMATTATVATFAESGLVDPKLLMHSGNTPTNATGQFLKISPGMTPSTAGGDMRMTLPPPEGGWNAPTPRKVGGTFEEKMDEKDGKDEEDAYGVGDGMFRNWGGFHS